MKHFTRWLGGPRRLALLAALNIVAAGPAAAQPAKAPPASPVAATVLFAIGDVKVHRASGASALARGRSVGWGDAVVTGADGKLQLQLAEGAMVSLQPASQFELTAPRATQQPLRVVFGGGTLRWVGKGLPSDVQGVELHTQRAVITVRGPTFSAAYNQDGSVNIATERDPIEICNRSGCVELVDDGAVRVRSDSVAPARTNARATFR